MDKYTECKLKSGSVYGKTVYNICAGKDIFIPEPRYFDASVCVSYFNYRSGLAFDLYKLAESKKEKAYWLKEYCKWEKYARVFERSC